MNAALHPMIALLQSSSLATVVQQEIERAILNGEYAPGSKLNEATVTEKMGVSRGPVREAFHIVKAIASGDAETAGHVMFTHAMESKERTMESDLRRRAALEDGAAKRNTPAKVPALR